MENTQKPEEFLNELENAFTTVQISSIQKECENEDEFFSKLEEWIKLMPKYPKGRYLAMLGVGVWPNKLHVTVNCHKLTGLEVLAVSAGAVDKLGDEVSRIIGE